MPSHGRTSVILLVDSVSCRSVTETLVPKSTTKAFSPVAGAVVDHRARGHPRAVQIRQKAVEAVAADAEVGAADATAGGQLEQRQLEVAGLGVVVDGVLPGDRDVGPPLL